MHVEAAVHNKVIREHLCGAIRCAAWRMQPAVTADVWLPAHAMATNYQQSLQAASARLHT
jgi:hypothetical protein